MNRLKIKKTSSKKIKLLKTIPDNTLKEILDLENQVLLYQKELIKLGEEKELYDLEFSLKNKKGCVSTQMYSFHMIETEAKTIQEIIKLFVEEYNSCVFNKKDFFYNFKEIAKKKTYLLKTTNQLGIINYSYYTILILVLKEIFKLDIKKAARWYNSPLFDKGICEKKTALDKLKEKFINYKNKSQNIRRIQNIEKIERNSIINILGFLVGGKGKGKGKIIDFSLRKREKNI